MDKKQMVKILEALFSTLEGEKDIHIIFPSSSLETGIWTLLVEDQCRILSVNVPKYYGSQPKYHEIFYGSVNGSVLRNERNIPIEADSLNSVESAVELIFNRMDRLSRIS